MLGNVARLLSQVERSTGPGQREAAVRELWALYSTLEADLLDAETYGRRLETTAYRSALKTLGIELGLLGLERPPAPSPSPHGHPVHFFKQAS